MNITVVYVEGEKKLLQQLVVPEESTVAQAIDKSDLGRKFPHVDIATAKVGVFGKVTKLNAAVNDGDRIEIYRPITADPETAKKKD